MNIHSTGKDNFIVELSKKDMQELDITYEEMDYSKIETRRVIWTIIEKARDNLGRDIDPSGNLIIEASADTSGGCVLSFTVTDLRQGARRRHPLRLTKTAECVVYEFDNIDNLLDIINHLKKQGMRKGGRIFSKGEKYRLIFDSLPGEKERRHLEEYATPIVKNDLVSAHTVEHWKRMGRII